MARVLVIHYTNKGKLSFSKINQNELLFRAGEWLKANPDVKFNGTFADKNGVGISDWEAPSIAKVKQAVDSLKVPYDTIVEVTKVLP
jgi:hypothetical protein